MFVGDPNHIEKSKYVGVSVSPCKSLPTSSAAILQKNLNSDWLILWHDKTMSKKVGLNPTPLRQKGLLWFAANSVSEK